MNYLRKNGIVLILMILGGVAIGYFVPHTAQSSRNSVSSQSNDHRAAGDSSMHLTNPLLECAELPEGLSIGDRVGLQKRVQDLVTASTADASISQAAIYYRDLNNGPWFGVNESLKFHPASLLKLPLAMSFYHLAEDNPQILTRQFQYERGAQNYEDDQAFGVATNRMENNKVYSVEHVIEIMLQDSSNEAALLLVQLAGDNQIRSIYRDFGLVAPSSGQDIEMDVHTYASFFRILFNATYIDREYSEKLLAVLTQASFKDGLVAGVPANIPIAHKFGTREIDAQNLKQLHDCGIIYAPGKPYILCVMTQGTDFMRMAAFIKDVSAIVYKGVTE